MCVTVVHGKSPFSETDKLKPHSDHPTQWSHVCFQKMICFSIQPDNLSVRTKWARAIFIGLKSCVGFCPDDRIQIPFEVTTDCSLQFAVYSAITAQNRQKKCIIFGRCFTWAVLIAEVRSPVVCYESFADAFEKWAITHAYFFG